MNNIADSDVIAEVLAENGLDTVIDRVSGLNLYLLAGYGPYFLIGEYTTSLESFASSEIGFKDSGAKPEAWNIELGYTRALFGKETVFAIGYQGTKESVELDLPRNRYIGAASLEFFRGATLSLEYFHDKDYSIAEGGSGENAGTFTTQLEYEF